MSNTKIKICDVIIDGVNESEYNGSKFFCYFCKDGSVFNSKVRFNSGDIVNVFIVKYKGTLSFSYSLKE